MNKSEILRVKKWSRLSVSSLSGQIASESARERHRVVWTKSAIAIGVYTIIYKFI